MQIPINKNVHIGRTAPSSHGPCSCFTSGPGCELEGASLPKLCRPSICTVSVETGFGVQRASERDPQKYVYIYIYKILLYILNKLWAETGTRPSTLASDQRVVFVTTPFEPIISVSSAWDFGVVSGLPPRGLASKRNGSNEHWPG